MVEWQFTDKQLLSPTQASQTTGYYAHFLSDGELWFYRDTDRSRTTGLKTVYKDPAGVIPYTNPIKLDVVGAVGLIYFQEDEPYYIELREPSTPSKPLGDIVREWEHYVPPSTGTPPPITTFVDFENFVINGQFSNTFLQTHYDISSADSIDIAPSVRFQKSNTSGTDEIEILDLPVGTELEGRPKKFVRYTVTSGGSGEVFKDFIFDIGNVQTFANQTASFAFQGRSSTTSPVTIYINQHFGTGGAPSADVETNLGTKNLTTNFDKYEVSGFAVPSIGGKTLGTNGDDRLEMRIRMPLNVPSAVVDLTNNQLNEGNSALVFAAFPLKKSSIENNALQLPLPSTVNPFTQKYDSVSFLDLASGLFNLRPESPVGSYIFMSSDTMPTGYLSCEGGDASTNLYRRLFDYWGGAIYGIGTASASAIVASNLVTITNSSNGAVSPIGDVDTGFVFAVTQTGSPTLPQVSTVTTNAGSAITNGASFDYTTVAGAGLTSDYRLYFRKNFEDNPPATSRSLIPIDYTGSESANEIAVLVQVAMNPISYTLPDWRGLGFRGWNHNKATGLFDPDAAIRLDRGDGTAGDNVGTTQADDFKSHDHDYTFRTDEAPQSGEATPCWNGSVIVQTGSRGGNETRMKNIYGYVGIKY